MPSPDFYPHSWQWLFYILGWFFGTLTIVFWMMMYMAYLTYDKPQNLKFINNNFHRRIYLFGVITSLIFIIISSIVYVVEYSV